MGKAQRRARRRNARKKKDQPQGPSYPEETLAKATLEHHAGNLIGARAQYQQILETNPEHPHAIHGLGLVAKQLGQTADAIGLLERAINIQPDTPVFHYSLGQALKAAGDLTAAAKSYQRAIDLQPDSADAHNNLGNIHSELGDLTTAAGCYIAALEHQWAHPAAHNNLGTCYMELERNSDAAGCFEQAIELQPIFPQAHLNLGNARRAEQDLQAAASAYAQALSQDASLEAASINLGNTLRDLGRFDEAVTLFRSVIETNPSATMAHFYLGNTLQFRGDFEAALQSYEAALAIDSELAEAHFCRATIWLSSGDMQRGFREYQWRWKSAEAPEDVDPETFWRGETIPDGTILLRSEQGMGDIFQFIRYAPQLKERCKTLLFECRESLIPLIRQVSCIDQLIPTGEELPTVDAQVPLMDLPLIFETDLDSIPTPIPYLRANEDLARKWSIEAQKLAGVKVGINWEGDPTSPTRAYRTLPLNEFGGLAKLDGVSVVSLQYREDEEAISQQLEDLGITDWGLTLNRDTQAFEGSAAALEALDLVITNDTAIAHLAGAMGRPVWLLLPIGCEWRWLRDRSDSPWYPSMRIFRQTRAHHWTDLFDEVASQLHHMVAP